MKKIILAIAAMALVSSMIGCKGGDSAENKTAPPTTTDAKGEKGGMGAATIEPGPGSADAESRVGSKSGGGN